MKNTFIIQTDPAGRLHWTSQRMDDTVDIVDFITPDMDGQMLRKRLASLKMGQKIKLVFQ